VRVVGWIKQFVDNCKTRLKDERNLTHALSLQEFKEAEAEHTLFLQAQLSPSAKRLLLSKAIKSSVEPLTSESSEALS